jgi:hypothetical protein
MARGDRGVPKVSLSATPHPSTPCGQATPEWPYSRFLMARPQGRGSAGFFYPFGHTTPYAYDFKDLLFGLNPLGNHLPCILSARKGMAIHLLAISITITL